MAVRDGYCAGDLALALDDYKVGDMVRLKVQRGAGDPQVCPSPRLASLRDIAVHDGDSTSVPGQGHANGYVICALHSHVDTDCNWLLEQI